MSSENIMRLWNDAMAGGTYRPTLSITAKTADYTITKYDFGKVFTTRGASDEVIFTLPAVSDAYTGKWVVFISVADENLAVKGSDEELVVFNDLTADAISFSTSSEKIAGAFFALCDGTSWIVLPIATETQTVTVSTAASSSPSSSESSSPSESPSSSPSATG
jgi:hypothetical protein